MKLSESLALLNSCHDGDFANHLQYCQTWADRLESGTDPHFAEPTPENIDADPIPEEQDFKDFIITPPTVSTNIDEKKAEDQSKSELVEKHRAKKEKE